MRIRSEDLTEFPTTAFVANWKTKPRTRPAASFLASTCNPASPKRWRKSVPNDDADENTKRKYVLEAARRMNLIRRDMASMAGIRDIRAMNYWLRGKNSGNCQVVEAGRLLYLWAASVDFRVGEPADRV